jgi:hypothetical protein
MTPMDDQSMLDQFDSLKREVELLKLDFKQEIRPLKEAIARLETRLSRDERWMNRWLKHLEDK